MALKKMCIIYSNVCPLRWILFIQIFHKMKITKKTLGVRNCNPLNIRFSPNNNWKGQTGCNRGFCTFIDMEHGFRAALVLLRNYLRRGLVTPRQIISNWAPANENDTEAYIRNAPYPWSSDYRLSSPEDVAILCAAMAYIESLVEVNPIDLLDIIRKYDIQIS